MAFPRILTSFAATVLFSTLAAAVANCYNYAGDIVPNWYSCNSDDKFVSSCCGSVDYCLGNGLCLNTGYDNFYTQQGCTHPGWTAPCKKYCESGVGVHGNFSILWLCANQNQQWCCGDNSSCCDSTNSSDFYDIVHFTAVTYPPQAPVSTGPSTSTSAAATATTTGGPSAATAVSTAITATTTSTASAACPSDTKAVKLGVGIGIPLGLVTSALALAAGFFLGKKKRVASEVQDPSKYNLAPQMPIQVPQQRHELD